MVCRPNHRSACSRRHQGPSQGAGGQARQLSESALLKDLLELTLGGPVMPEPDGAEPVARAGRRARLYVRLRPDDQLLLMERAAARRMAAATYVSVLVRAHLRQLAPLPAEELRALNRVVAELGAIGRNLNQIARATHQAAPAAEHHRGWSHGDDQGGGCSLVQMSLTMIDSTQLKTWVLRDTKDRFTAVARHQGLSDSALLKRLVELMLQTAGAGQVVTVPAAGRPARDTRLTVRLHPADQSLLRERAAARGIPASTYVSVLTRAHLRSLAPLPKEELLALSNTSTSRLQKHGGYVLLSKDLRLFLHFLFPGSVQRTSRCSLSLFSASYSLPS